MDESARILRRLRRIETLDAGGAPPGRLFDELRALVREAETWSRSGADCGAASAPPKLPEGVEGMS